MEAVKAIVRGIKQKNLKPIYFLMGEESYYIDKISDFIATNVLTEEERSFNQMSLYGKETSVDEIVSNAKRFPMMAEYQVIIVKEAQELSRTIENLINYAENPQLTTVLVICFKYKKLDKRKKLYKAVQKNGVLFESKKLYENQVVDWIVKALKGKKYQVSPKAAALLVEFLGTDLSRISNELEKLFLAVPKGSEITPADIEEHIGISKDYNNFELKKAIGERNIAKASKIINYFSQNPKDNPFVLTITLLHSFFTQLLQYHGLKDHSSNNIASALSVSPYFVDEYKIAARNYPMKKVSKIVSSLRQLDLKGKGVDAQNMSHSDLLKELLVKIV